MDWIIVAKLCYITTHDGAADRHAALTDPGLPRFGGDALDPSQRLPYWGVAGQDLERLAIRTEMNAWSPVRMCWLYSSSYKVRSYPSRVNWLS